MFKIILPVQVLIALIVGQLFLTQVVFFNFWLAFCLLTIGVLIIFYWASTPLILFLGLLSSVSCLCQELSLNKLILASKANKEKAQIVEGQIVELEVVGLARSKRPGVYGVPVKITSDIFQPSLTCQFVHVPWKNERMQQKKDLTNFSFALGQKIFARIELKKIKETSYFGFRDRKICKVKNYKILTDVYLDNFLAKFKKAIQKNLGVTQQSGLLLSMALGVPSQVSLNIEQQVKSLGLMHLLVLSGYQVSLVFFLVLFAVLFFLKQIKKIYWNGTGAIIGKIIAFSCATCLVFISGFESAGVRALITIALKILAENLGLKTQFIALILMTAFFDFLFHPISFLEVGPQLTYAALIGIGFGIKFGASRKLQTFFLCNFFASLFTSLVTFLRFGTISFYGFILNPLLAPILSILGCPLVFITLALQELGLDSEGLALKIISQSIWLTLHIYS